MKKWVVILSLIILATITYSSWSSESDYYVKAVSIHKAYHHNNGFIIQYLKQDMSLHQVFVPYKWFDLPDDKEKPWKAEVFYGSNPEYPYMNIYWDKGEFSHLRLYLREQKTDPSWGTIRNPRLFDDKFDIEIPDLSF